MYRDYGPKNVKFFFIYKSLAHPELAGDYVQPFTLEERLTHAQQAEKQLGATVPWIVDAMDNRLKHALGDRPNSEFIIDPDGKIVRKRAWSNPAQVRRDLEELVGPVDQITREEDIELQLTLPPPSAAKRGVVARIERPQMQPIVSQPEIKPEGLPFFAKLRAEAARSLINRGKGQLYLGFHLDPFHNAHWNNLTDPLSIRIEADESVKLSTRNASAEEVEVTSDADPREFLINVESWPDDQPIHVTVSYFACVGDDACYAVMQSYTLKRERDMDGGGARGEGAGFWEAEDFAKRILAEDTNGDGKVSPEEVSGIVLPHFEKLDTNSDGFLNLEELKSMSKWLNEHHQPGVPDSDKSK